MFGGRDRDSTFGDCWWLDMSEVDRLPLPSPRGGEMQQGTSPVDRSSPLPAPAARISTPTTPQPIARAPLETSGSYPGIQAGLSTAASNSAPTSANNLAALHSSLDEDAVAAMMVANTAAELERLRASFGMERVERRPMLRSEPSQATPPAAMVDASLADYGRRSQPQASSGQNPTAVALGRQCLAHCPAGQLRLGDVWLLLADYKRLVGQMDILQAWREPRGGGTTPGRFSQLGAEGVRLGDLEAILAEYQKLVKVP
ncbi:unnamed protein product [Ostreobium quekettii]|uniref:Uncharacterized protein n=1 Tax=Ostreobium quekettii TaxID=121088 RepID=A0A8S1JCV5_9CHLO|nr:unnamed protein product [Ostreobium quekettii]|eukprot:evm.model.scf_1250.5 EVM.evm.TU.scf_1250.5   scf_1250:19101-22818(-)